MPASAVTHPYGVKDVERLLRIPQDTIRALVSAGFVAPARGARNTLRFSFQDLIVLRTAQSLVAAQVPARRIARALKSFRRIRSTSGSRTPRSGWPEPATGGRTYWN